MPESAVTISVDERDDGPLRVGDTLRGTIQLDLRERVSSGELTLDFVAELTSCGKQIGTQHQAIVIDSRSWKRGHHEYPFAIRCNSPPSYASDRITVTRRLEATLQISEHRAVTGTREITLHARPTLDGARIASSEDPRVRLIRERWPHQVWELAALPTAVAIFVGLGACAMAFDLSGPLFFPLALVGCGLVFMVRHLLLQKLRRTQRRIGSERLELTLSPDPDLDRAAASAAASAAAPARSPARSRAAAYRTAPTTLESIGLGCEVVTRGSVRRVDVTFCIQECAPDVPSPRQLLWTELELEPNEGGTWTGWLPLKLRNGALPPLFSFSEPWFYAHEIEHYGLLWELWLRIHPRNGRSPVIEKHLLQLEWDGSQPQALFDI